MTGPEPIDLTQPVNERDHVQGPWDAPTTLVVYGDYECPYTRRALFSVKRQRELLGEQLRYVFRNFPLYDIHPHAFQAAEAAEAAAAQSSELFWTLHAYLFAHQHALEDKDLQQYAAQLGLEMAQFERDMAGHAHESRIQADIESGLASGVMGTPTLFINGQRFEGSTDVEPLLKALMHTGLNL